jgi:hypothetical protein
MSIFGTIMSKIFQHAEAASSGASPQPSAGAAPESTGRPTSPVASTPPIDHQAPTTPSPAAPTQVAKNDNAQPASTVAQGAPVDVGAVLDGLAAKNGQRLDWKHSIVDTMKLLDMDSSLTARKALAEELHYTGNTNDSAGMNIWLHKQVMQKLADNGGKLPADLRG